MTAPYAVRRITVTITLGQSSTASQLVFKGHRVQVHVSNTNTPSVGLAQIRIYGLNLDHINQISVAGLVYQQNKAAKNSVKIEAGDDISGMSTLFNGTIYEAYPDMKMPDVSFVILANPASTAQLNPVEPSSFPGAVSVDTVLQSIVKKAGLALENNGVKTILASPYFPGTAWNQLLGVIRAADCFGTLDYIKNVIAVWTKNGSRAGNQIVISPETGMIGYPQFQTQNIIVRTLFNTDVSLSGAGKVIRVRSELKAADGVFTVYNVTHDLMSEMPDGPWETTISAYPKV